MLLFYFEIIAWRLIAKLFVTVTKPSEIRFVTEKKEKKIHITLGKIESYNRLCQIDTNKMLSCLLFAN